MRHFPHHIGDYAAATAHLSFVEDAAYHRLLRLYYRDEKPLPADIATCQRLVAARSKEERAAVEAMLHEFFRLEADGWHQSRADDELVSYQIRADAARENGKRSGGRPKTGGKPKVKPTENQLGLPVDTQGEPSATLTINHKPITNNQSPLSAPPHVRRTALPTDWRPDEIDRLFAVDLGLDSQATLEAFLDYWTSASGGKIKRTDWSRTWRVWCRREANWGRKPREAGLFAAAPTETYDQRRIRLAREAIAE